MLRFAFRLGVVLVIAKLVEESQRAKRDAIHNAVVAELATRRAAAAETRAKHTDDADRACANALARVAQLEVANIALRRTVDKLMAERRLGESARGDADEIIGQKA
jgi:hypothetical protein